MTIGFYFKIAIKKRNGPWFAYNKYYSEAFQTYKDRKDPLYNTLQYIKRKTPSP